jgi:WD40 repeat protein
VICLLSHDWEDSPECVTEFRMAENLGKQILCARLADATGRYTGEWQHCDLFAVGQPDTELESIPLPGGGPVVFAKTGLRQLREAIRGTGIGAENFVWPPAGEADRVPYRGWEPFAEVDAGVFFGRDAEIVHALDTLRGMRTTGVSSVFVVLGPSGSGKSSFLRAGLLPRLRREDRRFVLLDIVRPERYALTGATGLARAIYGGRRRLGLEQPVLGDIESACVSDPRRVHALLAECRQAALDRLPRLDTAMGMPTLVLPLDQAEELFSADAGPEAAAFLTLMADLARPSVSGEARGLILAATIRTDRYEVMQTAPELASLKSLVFDDLKPMSPNKFREVITGPASRASDSGRRLGIAPNLVDRLLEDAAEGGDALPLLALTLRRLYDRYAAAGELTLGNYEAMGGMRRVVQTTVDEVISTNPQDRSRQLAELRAAFIPWLATVNQDNDQPMRRVARWSDLPESSWPLIAEFVEKRLLVRDYRGSAVVVEVALESLLRQWDALADWLKDQREDLKAADALERNSAGWISNNRNPDWLLTGSRLADGEELAAKPGYRDRLKRTHDYLTACRDAEDQRLAAEEERRQAEERRKVAEAHAATLRRRSRVLYALLSLVVIVALVAVLGFLQAVRARHQADARGRELQALRLQLEAQGMLAGIRPGGDVRAFQELLAADKLGSHADSALLNAVTKRLSTSKIVDTGAALYGVAFAPDARRVASGSADGSVRLWDADTGKAIGGPLTGHTSAVVAVVFSPDGRRLASASMDKTLRLWNADTGQPLGLPLTGHSDVVQSVAFSPDGHRIASASADHTLRLWDADTGRDIGTPLTGHTGAVASVAFSPDGHRLASASRDGTVRLWDAGNGQPIGTPLTGHTGAVNSVMFSPDGHRLATAGADKTIRLWNADTGDPLGKPLTGQTGAVAAVAFSPDGHGLVSGGADNTVRLWSAETAQPIGAPLVGHTDYVTGLAFSPDGHRLITSSMDHTIRLWNLGAGEPLTGHTGPVSSVAFSPDGQRLASAGYDNTVRLWNVDTDQPIGAPLSGHTRVVNSVVFSPDGHRLASASDDQTVRLWNADTGQPLGPPLPGMHGAVLGLALSPDGHRLALANYDDTVQLWNADTRKASGAPLTGHVERIMDVTFSPDGHRLASASADKTIRLWNADTGQPLGPPLTGHSGPVSSVAFSPDGHRLASASWDQTVRVWNADTGQPIGAPLAGHTSYVTGVAYSPDGRGLVTSSNDGTVRTWDADTGQPLGDPLTGHDGEVLTAAFSPDGRRIVSGGEDATIRLWPAVATPEMLCAKLSNNMSRRQWLDWISPEIPYTELCPGLPPSP